MNHLNMTGPERTLHWSTKSNTHHISRISWLPNGHHKHRLGLQCCVIIELSYW